MDSRFRVNDNNLWMHQELRSFVLWIHIPLWSSRTWSGIQTHNQVETKICSSYSGFPLSREWLQFMNASRITFLCFVYPYSHLSSRTWSGIQGKSLNSCPQHVRWVVYWIKSEMKKSKFPSFLFYISLFLWKSKKSFLHFLPKKPSFLPSLVKNEEYKNIKSWNINAITKL